MCSLARIATSLLGLAGLSPRSCDEYGLPQSATRDVALTAFCGYRLLGNFGAVQPLFPLAYATVSGSTPIQQILNFYFEWVQAWSFRAMTHRLRLVNGRSRNLATNSPFITEGYYACFANRID